MGIISQTRKCTIQACWDNGEFTFRKVSKMPNMLRFWNLAIIDKGVPYGYENLTFFYYTKIMCFLCLFLRDGYLLVSTQKTEISVIKSLELFLFSQLHKPLQKVIILTFWQKLMKNWDFFDGSRRNRRSKIKKLTFIRGNHAHFCLNNGILTFSEKNVLSSELAIIISALWANECTFSRFPKNKNEDFRKIRLFVHKSVRTLDLTQKVSMMISFVWTRKWKFPIRIRKAGTLAKK